MQGADRLEALGALGLARCFYVAGKTNAALFHPVDPFPRDRPLDDTARALDHFPKKLLTLADTMQTRTGTRLAQARTAVLHRFLADLAAEIA